MADSHVRYQTMAGTKMGHPYPTRADFLNTVGTVYTLTYFMFHSVSAL